VVKCRLCLLVVFLRRIVWVASRVESAGDVREPDAETFEHLGNIARHREVNFVCFVVPGKGKCLSSLW
jgi:hypothetical protein